MDWTEIVYWRASDEAVFSANRPFSQLLAKTGKIIAVREKK